MLAHLLVMGFSREGLRHSGNADFPLLSFPAPSRILSFSGNDDLMLDRVALLLAAVPFSLSALRTIDRLLGSIEEQCNHFVLCDLHFPLGDAEDLRQKRLERVDVPPHVAVVDPKEKTKEHMGHVCAVVDEEHEQTILKTKIKWSSSANLSLPFGTSQTLFVPFLVDWLQLKKDLIKFLGGDPRHSAKRIGVFFESGKGCHGTEGKERLLLYHL